MLTRNQIKAKVEAWVKKVEKTHAENLANLWRLEDLPQGEREDKAQAFRFYFDGFLYEVINYYRSDGMHKELGREFDILTEGTGWFQEAETSSVEYFVEDN